jgi:hypothetical protein
MARDRGHGCQASAVELRIKVVSYKPPLDASEDVPE